MLDTTEALPKRHLPLEGSWNTRDLGGYETFNGRVTRWKTILRSGDLSLLTSESKSELVDYGIRTVVDLRETMETKEKPNVFATSAGIEYHHHDIMENLPEPERSNYDDAADWWLAYYSLWIDENRVQICDVIATVVDPNKWPVVFHCRAGKDRAGVVAGLVLSLVGVPSTIIAEDYAMSAHYLLDRFIDMTPPEELPINFGWEEFQQEYCPPEAMRKTLTHVESIYGSTEAYLIGGGVSQTHIDSIRAAFLSSNRLVGNA